MSWTREGYERRMAELRARRKAEKERTQIVWRELTFEERMERRRQRRATPEYIDRIEAIKRRRRHREIWAAIHASEAAEANAPNALRISPAFGKHS